MGSPSKIAVVICHGAYHSPAPYKPLVDALKAVGIEAYCPQLATSDLSKLNVGDINDPDFDREPPPGGYPQGNEDAEIIADVLGPLIQDQGKRVLLLAHSAGGWVATQAAKPELQLKTREANGQSGGIIGILYVGAFVIPVGESINTFFQPKDGSFMIPPFLKFHKHGGTGLATMKDPQTFLFNGVDPDDAKKWTADLTASPLLTAVLTNDAYAALPCAYVVLEGDLTLPKEYQEGMVAGQSAKTGEFTVYRSPAGHSPHITWTDGLVGALQDFVAKIGN